MGARSASESIPGLSPGAVGALTYIDVRITTVHPSVAGDFAAFRVVEPVLNTFKSLVIFQRELNGAGPRETRNRGGVTKDLGWERG